MDIQSTLQAIQDTPWATAIGESDIAFPILESVHVIGIALVLGTIAIVDLRLLGYAAHRRSVHRLIRELLPFTWAAFAVCVVTGLLMFASNAITYADNRYLWLKLGTLVLAGLNMAVFHLGAYRQIEVWDTHSSDTHSSTPIPARVAGLASMGLWVLVIFFGRWIGFS
jgi:hypothetical protein